MFLFTIVGGACAWLALAGALDPRLPSAPAAEAYTTAEEEDAVVGRVLDKDDGVAWASTCGRGRRAFVGDLLAGLPRKDRAVAFRILRAQLAYESRRNQVAWAFLYFLQDLLPLQRALGAASPALLQRLYAPAAWAYGETAGLAYTEWAEAVEGWCSGDGWVLG